MLITVCNGLMLSGSCGSGYRPG